MVSDFNKINTFLAIVQERSFSKASKLLGISQPAVTLQIKRLESSLQTTLIIRKKNGIVLTKNGEKFLQLCLKLEDSVSKFEKQSLHIKDDKLPVTIAAFPLAGQSIMPKMLDEISQIIDSRIDVRVVDYSEISGYLLSRKCDFALNCEEIDNNLFYHKKLTEYEVVLISNRKHAQIDVNELQNFKFLKDKSKNFLYFYFDRYGLKYDDFPSAYFLNDPISIKEALLNNNKDQYFAFLPRFMLEKEIADEKLFVVPIKGVKIMRKIFVMGLAENKAMIDKLAAISAC